MHVSPPELLRNSVLLMIVRNLVLDMASGDETIRITPEGPRLFRNVLCSK